ncbi:MAG: glutamyl-tRNA reductase [Micromonosporaceae bacterium]|nr:glutamyl-tRNA reductase [Micromonosporaceae bacterium]
MNLLVVGLSHRTAGVPLLERLATTPAQTPHLLTRLLARDYVGEALVLSTCNRVEVYAAVSAFHGGLADIGAVLAERAGCAVTDLAPHLYVSYDDDAVRHAFRVAAGLDSMVVGEAQILGQLREAYALATEHGSAGRLLHEMTQQALRVGKRAHAETGIDRAGQSVVTAALSLGLAELYGPGTSTFPPDTGAGALVIGAGAMGALGLATLRRAGAGRLFITNRSAARARRLADSYDAEAVPFDDLASIVSAVDVVMCATASPGPVLTPALLSGARSPLLLLDLAVPRDVAPGVADLPGVVLVDLERLGLATEGGTGSTAAATPLGLPAHADVRAAEAIVSAELEVFRTWLRSSDVAPTVAALRARADEVVAVELRRLRQRRPDLTDEQRDSVAYAIHRVVQRLLHLPSVRVRQLAAEPGGEAYAEALRALFDLEIPRDIAQIDPVAAADVTVQRPEATP